jgi:hypothetical protein
MSSILELIGASSSIGRSLGGILVVVLTLAVPSHVASAQDRDRQRDDRDRDAVASTRLDPGMTIPVRATETIDARRTDYRVFNGVIDRDLRGDNGRVAIPRGSTVELMVRSSRPDEMVLDLESVSVNGRRYAVRTDPQQVVGTAGGHDIIGSIVGAIKGGRARGESVRVPGGSVINFRLERPLDVGVADLGVNRNGHHYHDYYGRGGRGGN